MFDVSNCSKAGKTDLHVAEFEHNYRKWATKRFPGVTQATREARALYTRRRALKELAYNADMRWRSAMSGVDILPSNPPDWPTIQSAPICFTRTSLACCHLWAGNKSFLAPCRCFLIVLLLLMDRPWKRGESRTHDNPDETMFFSQGRTDWSHQTEAARY